jgi:hypothetical protein
VWFDTSTGNGQTAISNSVLVPLNLNLFNSQPTTRLLNLPNALKNLRARATILH